MAKHIISTGKSCFDNRPINNPVSSDFILAWMTQPRIIPITSSEFSAMSIEDRVSAKNHEYFIGGETAKNSRTCLIKWFLSCDVDFAPQGFDITTGLSIAGLGDTEWYWHTTVSHTADDSKFRIVIPLSVPITDKLVYQAVCRSIMINMGLTKADATGFRFSQLMYKPQHLSGGPYEYGSNSGALLDAEDYLALECPEWVDSNSAPLFPGESLAGSSFTGSSVGNPMTRLGIVGYFNQAVSVSVVLTEWLRCYQYCVTRSDGTETWTLDGSSTSGGLHYYPDEELCYNHHQSDLDLQTEHCFNAFDLARLKMFGARDRKAEAKLGEGETPSWADSSSLSPSHKAFVKYLNTSDDPLPEAFRVEWKKLKLQDLADEDLDDLDSFDDFISAPDTSETLSVQPDEKFTAQGPDYTATDLLKEFNYDLSTPKGDGGFVKLKPLSDDEISNRLTDGLRLIGKDQHVENSPHNLYLICCYDPRVHLGLRFNTLNGLLLHTELSAKKTGNPDQTGNPIRDTVWSHVQVSMATLYGLVVPVSQLKRSLELACKRWRSCNPTYDMINQKPWSGEHKLATWLFDWMGAAPWQDRKLVCIVGTSFMINFVRRIAFLNHAPSVDEMMILFSEEQDKGKSYMGQLIAGRFFTQSVDITDDKTFAESTQGYALAEDAELKSFNEFPMAHVKSMITKTRTCARMAYHHSPEERPVSTLTYGSTNVKRCLKDPTGNRRFKVIEMYGLVDVPGFKEALPELFAEALHLARLKPINYTAEVKAEFHAHQNNFLQHGATTPFAELILAFICSTDLDDFDSIDRGKGDEVIVRGWIPMTDISDFLKTSGLHYKPKVRPEFIAMLTAIGYYKSRVGAVDVWAINSAEEVVLLREKCGLVSVPVRVDYGSEVTIVAQPISSRFKQSDCPTVREVKDFALGLGVETPIAMKAIALSMEGLGKVRGQKRISGTKTKVWVNAD